MVENDQGNLLRSNLHKDIDAISGCLLRAFGVVFDDAPGAAMSRWLDFRFRYVEPKPREIILSDQFPKAFPEKVERGFQRLIEKFTLGQDVNPHQSKTLIGRPRPLNRLPRRFRTDMLLADWGMSHFHLTDQPLEAGEQFTERSDWLAFCFVNSDQVAIVDVIRHPDHAGLEFADPGLLSTAIRSWPTSFEGFRVNGITSDPTLTMSDIHVLRSNSNNAFFSYEGHAYMGPGGGFMANKTMAHAYRYIMVLERDLDDLAAALMDPSDQFLGNLYLQDVDQPEFSMKVHKRGLGIYERTSQVLFGKVADEDTVDAYGLRRMSELLLPAWAMARVVDLKDTVFDDWYCGPSASS